DCEPTTLHVPFPAVVVLFEAGQAAAYEWALKKTVTLRAINNRIIRYLPNCNVKSVSHFTPLKIRDVANIDVK
ncbi:MAG: endonuclease V-like protein UPF0215 family, partial [Bermanella sp.]